jgi:multiple sugar transport system permease protein
MGTASISLQLSVTNAQRKRSQAIKSAIYHVSVVLLSLMMLYPILWMFASSLKESGEIWTNSSSLIPKNLVLENYAKGWAGFGKVTFATFLGNSLLYAGLGTIFVVVSSSFTAYGFSRIRFKGRNLWFTCMLLTLMLPSQVQIIPQYIMFSRLGWVNTYNPLLIPRLCGGAFFIFLIMQFIRGIPRELDEAAEIDGCNKLGIFVRIIFPLIRPAIITSAIFSFYWTWEDFFTPLLYLGKTEQWTVSLALRAMADPSAVTDWGAIFAMASLSLVPVFAIFIAFQKYLVQGISTTGLKG